MSGALEFPDPKAAFAAQKAIFNTLRDEISYWVEKPLRRLSYPEMPAGIDGRVRDGVSSVIATVSNARVAIAGVATDLKRTTDDLVEHASTELHWAFKVGDGIIAGADFMGVLFVHKAVNEGDYKGAAVDLGLMVFPYGKVAKGASKAKALIRGSKGLDETATLAPKLLDPLRFAGHGQAVEGVGFVISHGKHGAAIAMRPEKLPWWRMDLNVRGYRPVVRERMLVRPRAWGGRVDGTAVGSDDAYRAWEVFGKSSQMRTIIDVTGRFGMGAGMRRQVLTAFPDVKLALTVPGTKVGRHHESARVKEASDLAKVRGPGAWWTTEQGIRPGRHAKAELNLPGRPTHLSTGELKGGQLVLQGTVGPKFGGAATGRQQFFVLGDPARAFASIAPNVAKRSWRIRAGDALVRPFPQRAEQHLLSDLTARDVAVGTAQSSVVSGGRWLLESDG